MVLNNLPISDLQVIALQSFRIGQALNMGMLFGRLRPSLLIPGLTSRWDPSRKFDTKSIQAIEQQFVRSQLFHRRTALHV